MSTAAPEIFGTQPNRNPRAVVHAELCAARETAPSDAYRLSRAARAARARRGRRVSAGLRAPAGTHGQLPAWISRKHFVEVVVPQALAKAPRSQHHPVDPDTGKRVMSIFADHADGRTGRNCRPTNERVAELAGVCVRTVQRVRRLMEDLGLMVTVVAGRSMLTRAERLQAWRNGSSARAIATEVALVVPRAVARLLHRPSRPPVDDVTPPGYPVGELVKSPNLRFFTSGRTERRSDAPRRARPRRPSRPVTPAEVRTSRLIAGVQQRISWLSGVSPRRLRSLHRFAAQQWTERDVLQACDEVLRTRGWSVPDRITQPAAYLAALLRDVDPADRPGALAEAQHAEELARRDWLWQTRFGTRECAHGLPAGDLPHPIDGHLVCPLCRKERP